MSSPGPISKLLVTLDRVCDYIPLLSTISNSVDLFQRLFMHIQSNEPNNHYRKYVHEKDITRSLILLVPVVGNIAVGILDVKNRKTHRTRPETPPTLPPAPPLTMPQKTAPNILGGCQTLTTSLQRKQAAAFLSQVTGVSWKATETKSEESSSPEATAESKATETKSEVYSSPEATAESSEEQLRKTIEQICSIDKCIILQDALDLSDLLHVPPPVYRIDNPLEIAVLAQRKKASGTQEKEQADKTPPPIQPLVQLTPNMLQKASAFLNQQTPFTWDVVENSVICMTPFRCTVDRPSTAAHHLQPLDDARKFIQSTTGIPEEYFHETKKSLRHQDIQALRPLEIDNPYVIERFVHMQSEPQLVRDTEGNIKVAETIAHRLCAVLGIYTQAELADPNCSQTQPFPSAQFRTEDKDLLITFPENLCTAFPIKQAMQRLLLQNFTIDTGESPPKGIQPEIFRIEKASIKELVQETLGLKREEFATALDKILEPSTES